LKTIRHSLKNLGPSQKTLRPTWCPKLVTGLGKTSDGLAFLTNNRDVTLILRCYRRVVQKETQTEFYLLILLAGIL